MDARSSQLAGEEKQNAEDRTAPLVSFQSHIRQISVFWSKAEESQQPLSCLCFSKKLLFVHQEAHACPYWKTSFNFKESCFLAEIRGVFSWNPRS